MIASSRKEALKKVLGEIPLTAEVYWYLHQRGKPHTGRMALQKLRAALPEWQQQAKSAITQATSGKRVVVFGMLKQWISHTTLLSLTLAGQGHKVTLLYLPYAKWNTPLNSFDRRRQNVYIRDLLRPATDLIEVVSAIDLPQTSGSLPRALEENIRERAYRDTQYTMMVEEVDTDSTLYQLRLERNTDAARAFLPWLREHKPDVIITPNGSILEFGVVYEVARQLQIPVTTYEFGEQNERIWIAQNADVMRQETDSLWSARGSISLTGEEQSQIRALFTSRRKGALWKNFARQWQGTPSGGGQQARAALGLDERPLILIPTNVLGDSLTLGRAIFTGSMTEWLRRTVQYFIQHPEAQLAIRIHPGEQIGWGPSVLDILTAEFPQLPENIHVIPATASVNSYDLVEIADLGVVYTTTLGMEMAMSGLPVIVIGQTHYRGKGFTLDPDSWERYFKLLIQVQADPEAYRLTEEQVSLAWRYAYRYFFEYAQPFPWHLHGYWDRLAEWPIQRMLSPEGEARYGATLRYLTGDPIDWQHPSHKND